MRLVRLVANLGYGSQREVREMIRWGRVTAPDGTPYGPDDRAEHDSVLVDGEPLDPPPGVVLLMNKPTGYTCSTNDPGRIVYELLPERFMHRKPVIAPVGRLDRETSGLLLLTDDGQLLHRITSPKHHVPKTYEVTLDRPLAGTEGDVFGRGGLMLKGEKTPLLPARLEPTGGKTARLTITEGRYHQVRRMFAAVGNHVVALHRAAIGDLTLDDLPEGEWRPLASGELDRIFAGRTA